MMQLTVSKNRKAINQKQFWLNKAKKYGIPTEGREAQAACDAEARYRREYRQGK